MISLNSRWFGVAAALGPGRAASHDGDTPPAPHDIAQAWNTDLWLIGAIAMVFVLYIIGLARLWRHAGRRRGIQQWQLACYAAGMLSLVVTLISPLDSLGEALSLAHMAQHMLLIILVAPLLVLATPLPVYLWAFPVPWRRRLAGGTRWRWIAGLWKWVTRPLVAWGLYAVALWGWHIPSWYEAALEESLIHDLEHLSFLASALLLWWVALKKGPHGVGLALLLTTMLHSGVLAALMSFSPNPWYPAYTETTAVWGLTPLEDQQLAGAIMWIPGGIAYLLASLALLTLWLRGLDARDRMANAAPAQGNGTALILLNPHKET